jgi:prepilin-type N-terminal cleavage/methylation domain-containing protein/prepilin-type processing-associated H-X9-DG protein
MTDRPTCRLTSESSRAQRAGTDAFTLIELLVVIAVIAILAALLLPSLYGGKVEADSAVCKSNLHQLTLAMAMYAQDTGTYPYYYPLWEVSRDGWPAELQPYLKSPLPEPNLSSWSSAPTYLGPREGVWVCPAYNRLQGTFWNDESDWAISRGAYGYNASGLQEVGDYHSSPSLGLGGQVPTYGTPPPTRESQVLVPSDMIGIGDSFITVDPLGGHAFLEEVFDYKFYYVEEVEGLPPGNPAIQAMRQRHWGKFNIGFCDAHVESLRTNDLVDLNNSAVAQRWNTDHQPHNQGGFVFQECCRRSG